MNYHVEFQGKILKNMDFIKYLVSYVFFGPRCIFNCYYIVVFDRAITILVRHKRHFFFLELFELGNEENL